MESLVDENLILEKFYKLNPYNKEIGDLNKSMYLAGEGKKQRYNIFSWITGENKDIWVSALYLTEKLKPYGLTPQLYYDIVILRIRSIEDRPKCRYCNKPTIFKNMSKGYLDFCNLSCTAKWGNKVPSKIKNVSKALTGKRLSKEHRESLSKGAIKRLLSSGMGKSGYYKTKHGKYKPQKSIEELNYCSSWELNFMQYCDRDSNIKSILKVESISYLVDDIVRNYLPDFKLELISGQIILVEIKPHRLQYKKLNLLKKNSWEEIC